MEPKYLEIDHKFKSGENLKNILLNYSIRNKEINEIFQLLEKKIKINEVKINEKIKIVKDQTNNELVYFSYKISKNKTIIIEKNKEISKFELKTENTQLTKKILYQENLILSSLYKAAKKKNIPLETIIEFARIYGFQIDFQRDIRKRDYFQIMYEVFVNDDDKIIEVGNILYSNLNIKGINYPLYFYNEKNYQGHYDKNGKSIIKTLMKTPINGARLSSPFGMRKHPIDGFNKMHKGTDFAAPLGTPIMASGDGVIIKSGWCGGGGNCCQNKTQFSLPNSLCTHVKICQWCKKRYTGKTRTNYWICWINR